MSTNKSKQKEFQKKKEQNSDFVFSKQNYFFMILGMVVISLGFILMTGEDANTIHGKFDPNQWNPDIFSWRRIRLAPFLVILGFVIEIYAILVNPKPSR